jgi:hypothetical protein
VEVSLLRADHAWLNFMWWAAVVAGQAEDGMDRDFTPAAVVAEESLYQTDRIQLAPEQPRLRLERAERAGQRA